MEHTVVLRGRHVVLEPLLPAHAKDLAAAIGPDDDVFRWTNTAPRTEKEMEAWIAARRADRPSGRTLAFAQRDVASGRLAGSTSLFDIDEAAESAEIGHTWIAAPFRRSGLNTEAKLLLLEHAFSALRLKRVQLVTDLRNERSQNAIARLGATREGVLRNWRRNLEGGLRTSVVYSVLDSEWPDVEKRLRARLR
jgi:RimJ/RimL family protein N-acetyltransferase